MWEKYTLNFLVGAMRKTFKGNTEESRE